MKRLVILMSVFSLFFAAAPVKDGYQVGDTAADFKLKNVDGKMISLSDYKDAKGFIVIFDCNTCPFSKAYNGRIKSLNDKYASQGFPVLAINSNDPTISAGDSFDEMVKYAKAKGYTFPYLFDETQNVAKAFGATNTPHVYILTKQGADLKVAYIGAIDDSARDEANVTKRYVEDAISSLLSGKAITTTKTKAIGCTIK